MSVRPLRPTFVLHVPYSADEASDRLQDLLRTENPKVRGQAVQHHMMLTLKDRERRFWSPWLSLEIRKEVGVDDTRVYGRFSPEPGLWMGFMMTYFALGVIACFAAVWGTSQWVLNAPPTALWILPLAAVLALALWVATRMGQGLAAEEMQQLRAVIEESLSLPSSAPTAPSAPPTEAVP